MMRNKPLPEECRSICSRHQYSHRLFTEAFLRECITQQAPALSLAPCEPENAKIDKNKKKFLNYQLFPNVLRIISIVGRFWYVLSLLGCPPAPYYNR